MGYRNKEECLKEADRLGIDIAGMTWQQLQKAVRIALTREELGDLGKPTEVAKMVEKAEEKAEAEKPALVKKADEMVKELRGQTLHLIPELAPSVTRAIHYDEELGDDLLVEEKYYDIRNVDNELGGNGVASGTYILKGKTGRKVVAESALPKENPGREFTFGKDYVDVVTWNNTRGYRWKHVRKLLEDSGYYHQFKDRFRQPYVWYAAGIICCDIGLTNSVFKEIEELERAKRERGW